MSPKRHFLSWGRVSVVLFVTLLSVVIFGVVQGQEEEREAPRPPGPHPLEGFTQEDVPPSPLIPMMDQVLTGMLIQAGSIGCRNGVAHLTLEFVAENQLIADVQVSVVPVSSPHERPSGGLEYPAAGEVQRYPLALISTDELSAEVVLPEQLIATTQYKLSVGVFGTTDDGHLLSSNAVLVDPPNPSCGAGQ